MSVTDARKVEVKGPGFHITFCILEDGIDVYEIWNSTKSKIGRVRGGEFRPRRIADKNLIEMFQWLMKVDLNILHEIATRRNLSVRFDLRGQVVEEINA